MCSHGCVLSLSQIVCVFSKLCCHVCMCVCAGIRVLSRVCSHVCTPSFLRSHLCVLTCVLCSACSLIACVTYVCFHACVHVVRSHMSALMCMCSRAKEVRLFTLFLFNTVWALLLGQVAFCHQEISKFMSSESNGKLGTRFWPLC